jgi:hypothetical protein
MSDAFWIGLGGAMVAERMKSRKHQREEELMRLAREGSMTPWALPATRLRADVRFTAPGLFSFGLPSNFVQPDAESLQISQTASNTRILAAAKDTGPGPGDMFFFVYDGSDWARDLGAHSVWLFAAFADEFRERAGQQGSPVLRGPTPILIDGEKGTWWVGAHNEEGIEVHKWTVHMVHRGAAFTIIMHLRNDSDAVYSEAFWTAMSSWRWADAPALGAAQPPLPPPLTAIHSSPSPVSAAPTTAQTVAPWTSAGAEVSNDGFWWRSPSHPAWARLPYVDAQSNAWNGVAWAPSEPDQGAGLPPPPLP